MPKNSRALSGVGATPWDLHCTQFGLTSLLILSGVEPSLGCEDLVRAVCVVLSRIHFSLAELTPCRVLVLSRLQPSTPAPWTRWTQQLHPGTWKRMRCAGWRC